MSMHLKKLRATFYFYQSLAGATLSITITFWVLLCSYGVKPDLAIGVFLSVFKLLTDVLVWYFAKAMMAKQLYYYYNQHISKSSLWLPAFLLDLLIFIAGLWMI